MHPQFCSKISLKWGGGSGKPLLTFSCVLLQGKNLSNVNLMAATGSLPIVVIERSIPMFTPVTSPTIARSEAATNLTLTQAL